jgi:hypothetical protein
MATNPMQRKARNSFLLGALLTLLVTGAIIAILFMQLTKVNKEKKEAEKAKQTSTTSVYVLSQDVKSGQTLTADMFSLETVDVNAVPSNATDDIFSTIASYTLCDKEGNNIYTKSSEKIEEETKKASDDEEVASLYMYKTVNDKNTAVDVFCESTTGEYYTKTTSGEKTYIETTEKALIAKIDIKANTVITTSMIERSDEIITDDLRKQEYNMISLQTNIEDGDYIDVRLMLPSGQDFIVVSKKKVEIPVIDSVYSSDTIILQLSEDEILTMSNAIVEAWKISGAKLYATLYAEPGTQEAATPNYPVSAEVYAEIQADPNVVKEAMTALNKRYSVTMRNDHINSALSSSSEDAQENLETGMSDSITKTQEDRATYLETLVPTY